MPYNIFINRVLDYATFRHCFLFFLPTLNAMNSLNRSLLFNSKIIFISLLQTVKSTLKQFFTNFSVGTTENRLLVNRLNRPFVCVKMSSLSSYGK